MADVNDEFWNEVDWNTCPATTVRDMLHRGGVPYEVAWAMQGRIQAGNRAAHDLQLSRERVKWLTSQLPETKHWPPCPRDPYARAPADSDG